MVNTLLSPYLSFRDNAHDAMEFYKSVFGGELTSSTFGEFQASDDPAEKDKIMHSMLTTEGEMVLMASDTPSQMDYTPGNNFSISLSGEGRQRSRWQTSNDCTPSRQRLRRALQPRVCSIAVVITSLEDLHLFVVGPVDQPVLVVNAAGPVA